VLSASKLENLLAQMRRYDVTPYFDAVLGLDHIYATSKVELGREWLRTQQIDPADCVMIGDTLHDAQVAEALCCRCILAAGGHQSRRVLESAGCAVVDGVEAAARLAIG